MGPVSRRAFIMSHLLLSVLLLSVVALCGAEQEPEAASPGVDVRTLSHILPSLYNLGRYQPSYGYVYNRPSSPYVFAVQQPLPYVYNRPVYTAYSGASGSSASSGSPLFSGYNNNGYTVYPYAQPYGYGLRQGSSNNQDVSATLTVEPIEAESVKF